MGLVKFQCISLLITVLYLVLSGNIFQVSARTIDPTFSFAIENGNFAVNEYNMKHRTNLEYRNVVSGTFDIVKGIGHIRLIINVKKGRVEKEYKAHIIHYPNKPKQLKAFAPIKNGCCGF
ncbi:hypothetical protein ABFS82_01G076900 [Erythranthe guttata]